MLDKYNYMVKYDYVSQYNYLWPLMSGANLERGEMDNKTEDKDADTLQKIRQILADKDLPHGDFKVDIGGEGWEKYRMSYIYAEADGKNTGTIAQFEVYNGYGQYPIDTNEYIEIQFLLLARPAIEAALREIDRLTAKLENANKHDL